MSAARTKPSGRLLEGFSNESPRGMTVAGIKVVGPRFQAQNPAYSGFGDRYLWGWPSRPTPSFLTTARVLNRCRHFKIGQQIPTVVHRNRFCLDS